MRTLKQIQARSDNIMDAQKDNMLMMDGVHNIVEMNWKMAKKPWWVVEQISSDGYDSLKDAVDLMGTRNPKLSMTPYGEGEANRQQAEAIESALMWELSKVFSRRGAANKQATYQAYKYGRVAAQLVYLPWQLDSLKAMNKDSKRYERALQNGDFMLKVYDGRDVFPLYSDYGLEAVLVRSVMAADEVAEFWGSKADKVLSEISDEELFYVTVFDYWDLDQRTVWGIPHKGKQARNNPIEGYQIISEEMDLPFLPWIVSDLGDELKPMLYSVWKSGQWDLMNVYLSASSSEVRAHISYPRYKITGPDPSSVRIEMGEPGRPVEVPAGHDVEVMPPPGMDDTVTHMIDRLKSYVSKSTISHNVQTADFGSGAAYASIRELIELTSRRLNDGKAILENFYKEVFIKMCRWIHFMDATLTAYVDDSYDADQITLMGPRVDGTGVTFQPDNLDFKVELTADIPEDQVSRHNAAQLFVQLGGSKAKALEFVGIQNPQKEIDRARDELLKDASVQAQATEIQGMAELKLQMMGQQQMMAQQQQMAAHVAQAQQMQNPATQNLQGNAVNPAMGGQSMGEIVPGVSSPSRDNPPQIRRPGGA